MLVTYDFREKWGRKRKIAGKNVEIDSSDGSEGNWLKLLCLCVINIKVINKMY